MIKQIMFVRGTDLQMGEPINTIDTNKHKYKCSYEKLSRVMKHFWLFPLIVSFSNSQESTSSNWLSQRLYSLEIDLKTVKANR